VNQYMMATKAFHQLGEISRDKEDICHIHDETEKYYIGSWITGLGFIEVKFPKETTRELTPDEVEKYRLFCYQIGDGPPLELSL